MSGPIVKRCGCGQRYDAHGWKLLPKVGRQRDWVSELELRNCPCGTTLCVVVRRFMRFEPGPYILLDRLDYGGRKARSALRRLRAMGIVASDSREIIAPAFRPQEEDADG